MRTVHRIPDRLSSPLAQLTGSPLSSEQWCSSLLHSGDEEYLCSTHEHLFHLSAKTTFHTHLLLQLQSKTKHLSFSLWRKKFSAETVSWYIKCLVDRKMINSFIVICIKFQNAKHSLAPASQTCRPALFLGLLLL